MTSDGLNQYLYDAEGRVCAVEQSVAGVVSYTGYIYDAEGNRVAKGTLTSLSCDMSSNGFQQSSWDILGPDGEQVSETDGSGNWAHTNVFAGNQLVATYNSTGLHFQLSDWLGTRRVETDYAGNTQETCTNLPFGDGAANCTTPTEQFFTGYERDTESGNDYAQARYYASNMGRFITPDPYDGSYDKNNPQSFNRYAYVNGNPLVNVDPTGLAEGWANGLGAGPCSKVNGMMGTSDFNSVTIPLPEGAQFNPCAPLASGLADGIYYGLIAAGAIKASSQILREIMPVVGFGISLACDFDSGSNACGGKDWTSRVFGSTGGKVVGTSFSAAGATFGIMCAASGGWACPAALGYAIYQAFDDLTDVLWDLFGSSGPKFAGSLESRPGVPGIQGDSSFGVPVQNLAIPGLPGSGSNTSTQSFGMVSRQ